MSATTLTRAEKLARLKQLQQNQAELALFDLSNKQKRFWFAQQMDPKSGLNNIFGPSDLLVNRMLHCCNRLLLQ